MNVELKNPQTLVDEHQPLLLSIAKRIHRRLPPYIRFDDVLSYGQVGLVQASRSYNQNIGAVFATFAFYRIRGAIYDGLTKMAWTSRAEYRNAKAAQGAAEVLENEATTGASGDDDFKWLLDSTDRLTMVYLNSHFGSDEFGSLDLVDPQAGTPTETLCHQEALAAVSKLIEELPEPEKTLIQLTYFENHSLAEAADKLGKSRSWGSRVHARVLGQMGRSLQALGVEST